MKILVLISSEVFYVLTPYGVHRTQHWQSSSSSPSKFSLIILLEAKFCLGLDVTCRYLVQISRWMCRINLQFCSKFQVPEAIGIRILGCSPKKKKKSFPFMLGPEFFYHVFSIFIWSLSNFGIPLAHADINLQDGYL